MSRELEMALLTRILETGDLRTAQKAKVTKTSFQDDDAREAWIVVAAHYARHGAVPSIALLSDELPTFAPEESSDSVAALAESARRRELYEALRREVDTIVEGAQGDPRAGLAALQASASTLGGAFADTATTAISEGTGDTMAWYLRAKAAGGVTGIAYPWPELTKATGGLQPTDYVVVYAQPKALKTWLLVQLAYAAHKTGTVVFVTREMAAWEVRHRVVCLHAKLDWGLVRRGALSAADEARLEKAEAWFETTHPFQIVEIQESGMAGVGAFEAAAREHGATLALFDGLHLLASQAEWQAMAEISRAIRQFNLRTKIPVVAATQENEQGRVNYKSFQQDATLMIRLVREDEHRANREVRVEVPFSRDAADVPPFTIHALPAINLNQKAVLSADSTAAGIKPDSEPDNDLDSDSTSVLQSLPRRRLKRLSPRRH